jgi:hypothetical protein
VSLLLDEEGWSKGGARPDDSVRERRLDPRDFLSSFKRLWICENVCFSQPFSTLRAAYVKRVFS